MIRDWLISQEKDIPVIDVSAIAESLSCGKTRYIRWSTGKFITILNRLRSIFVKLMICDLCVAQEKGVFWKKEESCKLSYSEGFSLVIVIATALSLLR